MPPLSRPHLGQPRRLGLTVCVSMLSPLGCPGSSEPPTAGGTATRGSTSTADSDGTGPAPHESSTSASSSSAGSTRTPTTTDDTTTTAATSTSSGPVSTSDAPSVETSSSDETETGTLEPSPSDCPDAPMSRGLAVWLRSSDGISADGDAITAWASALSGRPTATQGDASRRPTLAPSALGGHPVVRFDGEDDVLELPYPVTGRDHLTIAAVSRTRVFQPGSPNADCDFDKDGLTDVGRELNCSGTDQNVITWNEGGGRFAGLGIMLGVGQTEVTFRFGTGQSYRHFKTPFVLEPAIGDRPVWWAAVMDGHARAFYLNGEIPRGRRNYRDPETFALETRADLDEGGGQHPDWPAAVGDSEGIAWIGKGRFTPATSHWAGDLAELLVYEVALTEAERNALGRYFACRYDLDP